jgi:hypothetical protein
VHILRIKVAGRTELTPKVLAEIAKAYPKLRELWLDGVSQHLVENFDRHFVERFSQINWISLRCIEARGGLANVAVVTRIHVVRDAEDVVPRYERYEIENSPFSWVSWGSSAWWPYD